MKNGNSRILNFVKNPKIQNSQNFAHAKITRSTVIFFFCLKLEIASAIPASKERKI